MKVEDPTVTVVEEYGQGVLPPDAAEAAVSSWAIHAQVEDEEGNRYWIDTILVAGWGNDVRILSVRTGTGNVVQLPDSIHKVVDFSGPNLSLTPFPRGEITARIEGNQALIEMEGARIECDEGKTWRYRLADKEKGLAIDWVHTSEGFPTWYGKEKPQAFTAHSVAYGYFWAGYVEGVLTVDGRDIRVKGKGARERVFQHDSSPSEVASWHEWIWFHFDEAFGTMDETKISKNKDGSLYLIDEKEYLHYRDFDIEHHDWAYHPELGAFVPTRYKVRVETEAGLLEFTGKVVGSAVWAVTGAVPDFPFALLHWESAEGTFTYKDGRKRTLTNGRAHNITRQWKPYPRTYSPEAFGIPPRLADTPIL